MSETALMNTAAASKINKALMAKLVMNASRKDFFAELSRQLQTQFHYDRLCINLYDPQMEMLTYFSSADGTVIKTLSPVRPAETTTTVAGHVIATRRPVIITDFNQYFSESSIHPIAEVGLKATMAFPLFMGNAIIATLHCSFAEIPDNIYQISAFLLELSPFLGICLGAILGMEQQRAGNLREHTSLYQLDTEESVICHSPKMREVMRQIEVVAKLDIPILILGETGTGKSMLAQYIHRRSARKDAQFVKVNCPALSNTLFESELFGHAKGAFTGASVKRTGRFELAHGGTLFLDEIGELSMEMQSKLLQVLDDSRFERVGESIPIAVDTRLVAATNVQVPTAIKEGKLREDLYHRLSFCIIELPSLRERLDDIPPLCATLSSQLSEKMQLPLLNFTPDLIAPMLQYNWPGNVRELRNAINKIMVQHVMHKKVTADMVRRVLEQSRQLACLGPGADPTCGYEQAHSTVGVASPHPALPESPITPVAGQYRKAEELGGLMDSMEEMERKHIMRVLQNCGGVISGPKGAATVLRIPRSTLIHRMQKLGLRA